MTRAKALAFIQSQASFVGRHRADTMPDSLWPGCSRLLTMLRLGRRIHLVESDNWTDSQSAALSRARLGPRAADEPATRRTKRQANCDVVLPRVASWPRFRHRRLFESFGDFRSRPSGAGLAVIRVGVRDVRSLCECLAGRRRNAVENTRKIAHSMLDNPAQMNGPVRGTFAMKAALILRLARAKRED
jgi:hypothetical protein